MIVTVETLLKYLSLTALSFIALLFSSICLSASNDSLQLELERAGRLIASTYVLGNPDNKLFGFRTVYTPGRPIDMIHSDIEINIDTKHSIQETKEKTIKIKGFSQFEKWLFDVRNNYRFRDNLKVRTMGVCVDGCCHYPLDGGISHNTLYLVKSCFFIIDEKPYLKSILLYDGD